MLRDEYTSSMDAERVRTYLLKLPHAVETVQWGGSLVFWVGDKAIGGKMFAVVRLDSGARSDAGRVISYPAGPERYSELLEMEGVFPAPYMARLHWVAVERWDLFQRSDWEDQLRAAHGLTLAKLPPRTREKLALPVAQQRRLIADRKKVLAASASAKD